MTWKRARSQEQVSVRLGEVVSACARLYGPFPFDQITLAAIAREAGWTRSNIYKYFETREEVLLEILKQDLVAWRQDVVTHYAGRSWTRVEFARSWTERYYGRDRMLKLLAILHTVLEKNCSHTKLVAFKASGMDQYARVATVIARALPFRDAGAVTDFLFAQLAVLNGFYPMWSPGPGQRAAMDAVGITADSDYMKRLFTNAIEALLDAAMNPSSVRPPRAV